MLLMNYRLMKEGEEAAVSELAQRIFNSHVAHTCLAEGVEYFLNESTPEGLRRRVESGAFIIIADDDANIVGMIEVMNDNHITQLFIDEDRWRQGVGQFLVKSAIDEVMKRNPDTEEITVNAAVGTVPFYEKCEFVRTADRTTNEGFVYYPMKRILVR